MSKSYLNEYCQKSSLEYPKYTTVKTGDEFTSRVTVDRETYSSIEGYSTKKEAEQKAAAVALNNIVQIHPTAKNVQDLLACAERDRKSGLTVGRRLGIGQTLNEEPRTFPTAATSPRQRHEVSSSVSTGPLPARAAIMQSPRQTVVPVVTNPASYPPLPPGFSQSGVRVQRTVSSPPSKVPVPTSTSHSSPTTAYFQRLSSSTASQFNPSVATTATPTKPPGFSSSPVSLTSSTDSATSSQLSSDRDQAVAESLSRLTIASQSPNRPQGVIDRPQRPLGQPVANFPYLSPSAVPRPNSQPRPRGLSSSIERIPFTSPAAAPASGRDLLRSPLPGTFQSFPQNTSQPFVVDPSQYNYVKYIELHCQRSNCKSRYEVLETSGQYYASVGLGGVVFKGNHSQVTFDAAKQTASLVALAHIGIQALGLDQPAAGGGVRGCG